MLHRAPEQARIRRSLCHCVYVHIVPRLREGKAQALALLYVRRARYRLSIKIEPVMVEAASAAKAYNRGREP